MNWWQFFTSNHWWGKILGAFFGYLLAGPVGALFGLFIGNFFDRGIAEHLVQPFTQYYAEKRISTKEIFFQATFGIMGHIAKADGHITKQEILVAKSFMEELRLNNVQKELAKKFYTEGKNPNYNIFAILHLLKEQCSPNFELLKLFLDIQYRAVINSGVTPAKINSLNQMFRLLGFAPLHQQNRFYTDFNEFNEQHNYNDHQHTYYNNDINSLKHAYNLLEVNENMTKQEIKTAYRRLISQNHPDKLIAKGLPETMIKMANEKTQKIRKAYEQICAAKGWKT